MDISVPGGCGGKTGEAEALHSLTVAVAKVFTLLSRLRDSLLSRLPTLKPSPWLTKVGFFFLLVLPREGAACSHVK